MKFERKPLIATLEKLNMLVCGARSSLAITECCHYNPATKAFYGTDLYSYVKISEPYEDDDDDPFEFVVPCKQLINLLKGISTSEVYINMKPEENMTEAESERTPFGLVNYSNNRGLWLRMNDNHNFVSMPVDDFPAFPDVEDVVWSPNMLKSDYLRKVNFDKPKSEDRRIHIQNLYLRSDGEMASTDGSRLHWLKTDIALSENVFINKHLAHKIERLGDAGIGMTEDFLMFAYLGTQIMTRLEKDGEFPKYEDIINRTAGEVAKIDRAEFLQKMDKFCLLSSDAYKGITFMFKDDLALISHHNPDWGAVEDEKLFMESDITEIQRIGVNPFYMRDALRAIGSDKIQMNVLGIDRPILMSMPDDHGFMAIVMPMKL